jgi:putative (di)nucleoside polyphosphate hydrolase
MTDSYLLHHDPYYRLGVGMMVLNHHGRVLVCQRADMAQTGLMDAWQMPQGGIDHDETPQTAAFRELEEEIGTANVTVLAESNDWLSYDLPRELSDKLWGGRYIGQRQKWFLMRYDGYESEINLTTPHPEFVAYKWIDPAELPELIVGFKQDLYRKVLAEFHDYL